MHSPIAVKFASARLERRPEAPDRNRIAAPTPLRKCLAERVWVKSAS
jgi:hypothetical protein